MGQLRKYGILFRHKEVKINQVAIQEEVKPVIAEVFLESSGVDITRSNTAPGISDYLIQNISEYRREDTSIRLLPSSDIMLDNLLKPIKINLSKEFILQ